MLCFGVISSNIVVFALQSNTSELHCDSVIFNNPVLIKKSRTEKRKNKVLPRFELGLSDSESEVLTITP